MPAGATISRDVKALVLRQRNELLFSHRQIAQNLFISKDSVKRVLRNFKRYGSADSLRSGAARGPAPAYTPAHMATLANIVRNDPSAYLDELADELLQTLGLDISMRTVSRMLKSMGLTRKQLQVMASQAILTEQRRYCDFIRRRAIFSDDLIFLDETYKNDRTCLRTHGRAMRGERAFVNEFYSKGQRFSCVGFLTFDGMLRPYVVKCTINTDVFTEAVKQRLLLSVRPGTIVVADNASYHYDAEWIDEVELRGGRVMFLPTYSPMFNPIEKAFGIVKAWLKRYRKEEKSFPGTGEMWLEHAFASAVGPAQARSCFRECTHPGIDEPVVYPFER